MRSLLTPAAAPRLARALGHQERLPLDVPKQRAALFGRGPAAGAPSGFGGAPSASAADGAAGALEEDNDRLVLELERKVSALKHATQGIHDEVADQNRLLAGMGVDFDRAGGLMAGTLARLDGLVRGGRGSQGYVCTVAMFATALFFVMWWLITRR